MTLENKLLDIEANTPDDCPATVQALVKALRVAISQRDKLHNESVWLHDGEWKVVGSKKEDAEIIVALEGNND